LGAARRDQFYAEGVEAARLYGGTGTITSVAAVEALFEKMRPRLEPSPIVFEVFEILGRTPILPRGLGSLQSLLTRGAVEIVPEWTRELLGLDERYGLRPHEHRRVRGLGRLSDRLLLPSSPPAQACRRLGLSSRALLRSA